MTEKPKRGKLAESAGKLIVFEGGDGSGKTTQTQLLLKYCTDLHIAHAYVDFPNYSSFFGKLIAKFLRGELGNLDEISPYLASLPFSLDRALTRITLEKYLHEGQIVVANRYASSNMAHQGSKFDDESERNEFLKWVDELEFEVNKIPREDLVLYLHVPWQVAQELSKQKSDRTYLNGKKDIQESDIQHRVQTENLYKFLASTNPHWETISCVENGTILPKEIIHKKIIDVLEKRGIL